MDQTATAALAIVGIFPAVAVLVAVFAQSKTIAAFAQLGGLQAAHATHAHPTRALTTLARALITLIRDHYVAPCRAARQRRRSLTSCRRRRRR